MRSAAGLGFLLALGIWVGHALAAVPAPNLLPTTTLPITTALPTLTTTTIPKLPTTTTLPKLTTTTVPKLTTTTVPKLPTTTTVPKLPTTTTVPKLPTTTTVANLPTTTTTALPGTTTATAGSSAPVTSAAKAAGSLASKAATGPLAFTSAGTSATSAPGAGTGASASSEKPRGASGDGAKPQVQLESSRPFITTKGPKSKRRVTLTFVLSEPGRVTFAVRQVSPVCRTIGYFSVRGQKGINRVRFAGRVGRKRLGPGTYTIFARTQEGGVVNRVTLVVVDVAKPSRARLRAARAANVCSDSRDAFAIAAVGGASISYASRGRSERSPGEAFAGGQPTITETPQTGGVLGTTLQKTADTVRPFVVGLLAAAILALGLAALPRVAVPDNRLSEALARHRIEITTVGAAALVAVAITFLLG